MADPTLLPPAVTTVDPGGPPPPTPEYVFREYAPRIYAIARRLLGNDADAEDVTQDVLVQVVRKLHTFRGDAQLPTWLHRVTVNAALAHREKRANRAKHETAAGGDEFLEAAHVDGDPRVRLPRPPADLPPDEIALAGEQRAVIERAIARLPDGFREVYVLADVEGLPNAEIGEIVGLSVAAVKSRLHRARLRMREMLAPHFEEVLT
jgi:RNA polymerase sigma-70 factor (ECF subfamily)